MFLFVLFDFCLAKEEVDFEVHSWASTSQVLGLHATMTTGLFALCLQYALF